MMVNLDGTEVCSTAFNFSLNGSDIPLYPIKNVHIDIDILDMYSEDNSMVSAPRLSLFFSVCDIYKLEGASG